MKPVILIDHESNDLYIAETNEKTYKNDLEKIVKENEKLNEEQRENDKEWNDYYEELSYRTWLNIYQADFLFI